MIVLEAEYAVPGERQPQVQRPQAVRLFNRAHCRVYQPGAGLGSCSVSDMLVAGACSIFWQWNYIVRASIFIYPCAAALCPFSSRLSISLLCLTNPKPQTRCGLYCLFHNLQHDVHIAALTVMETLTHAFICQNGMHGSSFNLTEELKKVRGGGRGVGRLN